MKGVEHFLPNKVEYLGMSLSNGVINCVGSGCPSVCIQESVCLNLGGIIFAGQCFLCGFGETYQNGNCQSQCSSNQVWQNGACVCANGYIFHNGGCQLCPVNSVASGDQTTCICNSNTAIYDAQSNICSECPPFSTVVGNSCQCNAGYQWNNGVCSYICGAN